MGPAGTSFPEPANRICCFTHLLEMRERRQKTLAGHWSLMALLQSTEQQSLELQSPELQSLELQRVGWVQSMKLQTYIAFQQCEEGSRTCHLPRTRCRKPAGPTNGRICARAATGTAPTATATKGWRGDPHTALVEQEDEVTIIFARAEQDCIAVASRGAHPITIQEVWDWHLRRAGVE